MGLSELDIFGSVPSKEESMEAICDLQMISLPENISRIVNGDEEKVPLPLAKVESKSSFSKDLSQPGHQFYELSQVLSQAQHKLLNALHLLWINPYVKNMVVSLSTDKAVWNAVMKNEMVQEFKKTYHADKYLKHVGYASQGIKTQWSDASPPGFTAQILSWLFEIAKVAVMKFIDDIISLVNKLFDQQMMENTMDIASDFVCAAFIICVLVFIVVILKRSMNSIA